MPKRGDSDDTLCPVARSSGMVGDRWTILIIRELSMGVSRFHELQAQTGATPQMLAARIKRLEADGLIERRPYSDRPVRHEYFLTQKGLELIPILLAFRAWGEKWCKTPDEGLAVRTTHRTCGTEIGLDGLCPTCEQRPPWWEMAAQPTPGYAEERHKRALTFRQTLQTI